MIGTVLEGRRSFPPFAGGGTFAVPGGGALWRGTAAALLCAGLVGCDDVGASAASAQPLSPAAALGKALFLDAGLSASGRQSCATCHVATRAFVEDPATDLGLPVPLGGLNMDLPGFRNTPSLMYASFTPPFSIDASGTPSGGFFRDGRASSLAVQAEQPFVSPFEMANRDAAEVIERLKASAERAPFEALYGAEVLDDPPTALRDMGLAIAAFETEDASFHPFSSKFDYWLAGKTQLTAQELRGLALFNDPAKGNCTACHPSQPQGFGQHALFTDFTYDNVGIPRNWNIPANAPTPSSPVSGAPLDYVPANGNLPADAEYGFYDLGLCGPFQPPPNDFEPRPLLSATPALCGYFKVPTLRNVAVTAPYFHNGVFGSLRQVLEWYVSRDINDNPGNNPSPIAAGAPGGNPYAPAGTFYTAADGTPDLYEYNDLPVDFDANVNIGEVPYTPPASAGGQAPTLDASEIADVIAFLCALTDGYDPSDPTTSAVPEQCQPGALGDLVPGPARAGAPAR
ncbi:MAG TPA: cytochrome c peroxidase [Anaeromyxobacteraceae bacterium]|nr:cytochrome c peroxidase [Anaeromyxobacteraceae bacterium]